MAKNNTIPLIIGIAIILFLILPNIQKQQNDVGVNVLYYKDGVQVQPQKNLFSVVTPDGGTYDSIAFKITVTNTGAGPLTDVRAGYLVVRDGNDNFIKFIYFGNSQIDPEWPLIGTGNLSSGQSITYTSQLISTSQFESLTQPVKFSAGVTAVNLYNNQNLGISSPFLSLFITPCVTPTWAYQESANVSSSCITKNTGYYSLSPYYVYVTYKKPTAATSSSLWKVKYAGRAMENVSIPSSCWSYSSTELKFRFYSNGADYTGDPSAYGQCYDGAWKTITVVGTFPGGQKNSPGPGGNKYLYDGDWNTGAYSYYGNQLFYQKLYSFDEYSTVYEEAMNWRF